MDIRARLGAAGLFLLSVCTNAAAQSVIDFEFSPKSKYENAWGIGYYQFKEEGIGFYGNLLVTLADRKPQYPSLNVASFGDPVTNRYGDLVLFNVGLTKTLAQSFAVYGGIGYGQVTGEAEKFDPLRILAPDGRYYVPDPANDKKGFNVNAGVLLALGKLAVNVGVNSFTGSVYFGVGAKF
jgi:hypothetical protein